MMASVDVTSLDWSEMAKYGAAAITLLLLVARLLLRG